MAYRTALAVIVAVGVLALGGAPTIAGSAHAFKLTIATGELTTTQTSSSQAGIISSRLGAGAVAIYNTDTSPTTASSRGIAYFANGSITFRSTLTGSQSPDGGRTLKGKGTITGGTGTYRHARGSFTFTGDSPPLSPTKGHLYLTGKITY